MKTDSTRTTMKTKSRISGYILRSSAAALLLSCMIVALSWAIDPPGHPPKLPVPQNNTVFGVNAHESVSSVAASAIRRNRTLTFADRVAYQRAIEEVYWGIASGQKRRPDPKPSLDAVMSQAQIEKKSRRLSAQLAAHWRTPCIVRLPPSDCRPRWIAWRNTPSGPKCCASCSKRSAMILLSSLNAWRDQSWLNGAVTKLYARDKYPSDSPLTNAENWIASAIDSSTE